MKAAEGSTRLRQVDDIAEALPQRAASLTRLFLARTGLQISRTEIGVLRAAAERPRRITELAEAEGISQPGITLLVNRLQERGWLHRRPDRGDRRAVLVELTPLGHEVLGNVRAQYRALLHEEMATLPDEDVCTLARAVEILDGLVLALAERQTPKTMIGETV